MSEMVRLGDVFNISSGGTPNKKHSEYYEGGTIPWIKTGDLKEMYISNHVEYITQLGLENSSAKIFPINTVLVAMYGATIGACSILPFEAATNQACAAFLPSETIIPNYLYYFLCSKKDQFVKDGVGGAQPNISAAYLKNVEIQIPSLNRQKFIISVLDKVSKLIALRKRQLDLLDEMVKARFVEMFGTINENPKHYPMAMLKDICHKITDGKHGGCEQESNSGYFYVGAREIFDNSIHYETAPQITYTDFAKDYKRCNIEIGDFVIVNTGATIGKSAIATSSLTERTLLQKSVALLKVNTEHILSEFLRYCYIVNPSMYMVESASAQPNLLLSKIKTTVVYTPPIKLQNQFADFVQQVEKSKATVQQALEKLNLLKSALMQEYFG